MYKYLKSGSISYRHESAYPDPDPHRSWIRNTVSLIVFISTRYLEIVEYPEEGAHLLAAAAVGAGAAILPQHASVP